MHARSFNRDLITGACLIRVFTIISVGIIVPTIFILVFFSSLSLSLFLPFCVLSFSANEVITLAYLSVYERIFYRVLAYDSRVN